MLARCCQSFSNGCYSIFKKDDDDHEAIISRRWIVVSKKKSRVSNELFCVLPTSLDFWQTYLPLLGIIPGLKRRFFLPESSKKGRLK